MKYGLLSINGPPIIEWYAGILLLCIAIGVVMMMWIEYQDREEQNKAKEGWCHEDHPYYYIWEDKRSTSDTGEGNQCSNRVLDGD